MLSTKLEITEEAYRAIVDLLEVKSLIEQVGIFFGIISGRKIRIDSFLEMENLDSSPSSFSIDYERLVYYIHSFQKEGKKLLGFFHSHPSSTTLFPSRKDKSFMKFWPYPYIWLIGIYPKEMAAFTLQDDRIEQLSLYIKFGS